MSIPPEVQDILSKTLNLVITGFCGWICHSIWKIVKDVSSIPDMKDDINNLYKVLRDNGIIKKS
jgi:TRAP-type C4-dicarboxylate transport system permease small subunit